MIYYCFQCRNCGRWGVKEIRNQIGVMFKCRYCNRSFKIKKVNEYGLALNHKGPYGLGAEASKICQKANEWR